MALKVGALRVGVQMDHISSVKITGDSTFALCLEAGARGHDLFHWTPDRLQLRQGRVMARIEPMTVREEAGNHYALGEPALADLSELDVVLLRQDPPFDMAYITTTHMLERIHPKTLVVNDPASVRNSPEKILVTEFPDLMPETLVTRDFAAIRNFRHECGDIIVKPLYGNGGAGVFRIDADDQNLSALLEMFATMTREPLMAQRYLPQVRQGDKRIILVDGKAAGAINRVPAPDDARSNMHVGGRAEHSELTARDIEICETIGPRLKALGLIFAGIDVIGGYLTEINVTSPTGIREIERFSGTNVAGADLGRHRGPTRLVHRVNKSRIPGVRRIRCFPQARAHQRSRRFSTYPIAFFYNFFACFKLVEIQSFCVLFMFLTGEQGVLGCAAARRNRSRCAGLGGELAWSRESRPSRFRASKQCP